MIYTSLDALAKAVFNVDMTDTNTFAYLGRLVCTYFDALHNPPVGIIGVGVITYAESALIDFQMNNATQINFQD